VLHTIRLQSGASFFLRTFEPAADPESRAHRFVWWLWFVVVPLAPLVPQS
jgi:hypothetical protein